MAEHLDMPDVTFEEARQRLKLGGDMDMLVTMQTGIKVVVQVRDDWLLACTVGSDLKPYSIKLHLVSVLAMLKGLLRLLENAVHKRERHVVL